MDSKLESEIGDRLAGDATDGQSMAQNVRRDIGWQVREAVRPFPQPATWIAAARAETEGDNGTVAAAYLLLDDQIVKVEIEVGGAEGDSPPTTLTATTQRFGEQLWTVRLTAVWGTVRFERGELAQPVEGVGFKTHWTFTRGSEEPLEAHGQAQVEPSVYIDGNERFARTLAAEIGWAMDMPPEADESDDTD